MSSGPLVTPLAAWLAALCTGASGAGITVPAGTFHSDRFDSEAGDDSDPEITVDRRLEVRAIADELRPFAGSCRYLVATFEVRIAYRYDLDIAQVAGAAGIGRTTIARNRAADDGALVREALLDPSNLGAASNGAIVQQVNVGARTVEDQGGGEIVSVLPVTLTARYIRTDVTVGASGT